jgi:hypothetical protein
MWSPFSASRDLHFVVVGQKNNIAPAGELAALLICWAAQNRESINMKVIFSAGNLY